jgi:hypothetical protein
MPRFVGFVRKKTRRCGWPLKERSFEVEGNVEYQGLSIISIQNARECLYGRRRDWDVLSDDSGSVAQRFGAKFSWSPNVRINIQMFGSSTVGLSWPQLDPTTYR